MRNTHYRKVTRSQAWPGTEATMRVTSRPTLTVTGAVGDLGSKGMFLITQDVVPVNAKAEITINFDTCSKSNRLKITALGETVHSTDKGIGIQFTSINLSKLQECIISKINKTGDSEG